MTFSESERRCFLAWSWASVRSWGTEGSEERMESMVLEI
jgi:hypothetical protein